MPNLAVSVVIGVGVLAAVFGVHLFTREQPVENGGNYKAFIAWRNYCSDKIPPEARQRPGEMREYKEGWEDCRRLERMMDDERVAERAREKERAAKQEQVDKQEIARFLKNAAR